MIGLDWEPRDVRLNVDAVGSNAADSALVVSLALPL
jgi:hypothetical protein